MLQYISFEKFNRENMYNRYFVTLENMTYIFVVVWNVYADCAFLSIYDYENNPIVLGVALVNELLIRNAYLPYNFYFVNKNGDTYEPTIDNIEKDFVLAFENGQ